MTLAVENARYKLFDCGFLISPRTIIDDEMKAHAIHSSAAPEDGTGLISKALAGAEFQALRCLSIGVA